MLRTLATLAALAAVLLWLRHWVARRRDAARGHAFIVCNTDVEAAKPLIASSSDAIVTCPCAAKAAPPSAPGLSAAPAPSAPAAAVEEEEDAGPPGLQLEDSEAESDSEAPPLMELEPASPAEVVRAAAARDMLASFHLPADEAAALLRSSGGLAAGGAMLHAYLGRHPVDHDGDLDLFVEQEHVPEWRRLLSAANYVCMEGTGLAAYNALIAHSALAPDATAEAPEGGLPAPSNSYAPLASAKKGSRVIQELMSFMHDGTGKKVQLVVQPDPKSAPARFDLSPAATFFDGERLTTMFPEATSKHEMFWMWREMDHRSAQRLKKYQLKGFTLVDRPPGLPKPTAGATGGAGAPDENAPIAMKFV